MAAVEIQDLFEIERCPSGLSFLLLIIYSPLGLILALIRFFIGFHAFILSCVLPKMSRIRSLVLRVMCGVLGIIVSSDHDTKREAKARVLVANYTSTLDHLALNLVTPTILPSVWDLPPTLMWLLGYIDMGARDGREVLIRNAKKHIAESDTPILVFPEGASTNGKKGLLKFSVWPFSLEKPVQPVVIQISRPSLTQVAPSVLGGRWWIDLFWFLFVPYSVFNIRFLPSVEEEDDETIEEFTVRGQKLIASSLGVDATRFTSADKVEFTKQKLFIQNQQGKSGGSSGDSALDVMVYQVKEVLPDVPVSAIKTDLALTKDVDLTITNILEGKVPYTPEVASVEASAAQPNANNHANKPSKSSLSSSTAAASSFGKTSMARSMSFQERKEALLDYARRKYKEKHGLQ